NDEAISRLSGDKQIADAFLMHDRDIVVPCDDSVVRGEQFIRRARGWTPRAIKLASAGPSVLAFGGSLKNTICITRNDEAFVSQHIGDLDNAASCVFHEDSVSRLLELIDVVPDIVAHDLHPDFHSSRFAAEFATRHGLPLIAVQHHHAHIAAVLAEHGHKGPVLGLAADGVGLGTDGSAWGGELLLVDGRHCRRLGNIAPLPLPGGDRAAREPWRMAAAALWRLGRGDEIAMRFRAQPAASGLAALLERGLNCPPTSSLGRVFDAAAGLLGVRTQSAFEGQAAMLLEGLAERAGAASRPASVRENGWRIEAGPGGGVLDLLPLLAALVDADDPAQAAAGFHATLAAALADWIGAAAGTQGVATVALAGGCLLNDVLTRALIGRLEAAGLRVLVARQLPPNDGGLSLGQAWVARQTLEA
ncbi:MAG TPA: carbamoyltransferase HypF, partial [Rhodocyclaceae bacterium]|nr:carbamoyltransferase HypF [Rhodocyclaceae bacterium]